jgi:cell division protein FtsW
MYAISPALAAQGGDVGENYFVTKQFIAIVLGLGVFFAVAKIPLSIWEKWQKPLVVVTFLLCLATVAFYGMGSRWLLLGNLSFQPVELVKFVLVISGAVILSRAAKEGDVGRIKVLKPLLVSLLVFSIVIIALQRDLGSSIVLVFITGLMAFMAGLPLKRLILYSFIAFVVVVAAISSTAYRRDRLLTFLQPERDCTNQGYHACQALIAVGSGGVLGVGLGRSVQAYGYLPEAENDSIFAIYAEKFGFVGVIILIGLFGTLLLRILNIMQRAPNKAAQLVCAGVFGWFGIQALVNIGAMIGLLPLKGITLPFVSYGGTSLIFVMAALGIVFQISSYTTMRKSSIDFDKEGEGYESGNNWRRNSRTHYTVTRNS